MSPLVHQPCPISFPRRRCIGLHSLGINQQPPTIQKMLLNPECRVTKRVLILLDHWKLLLLGNSGTLRCKLIGTTRGSPTPNTTTKYQQPPPPCRKIPKKGPFFGDFFWLTCKQDTLSIKIMMYKLNHLTSRMMAASADKASEVSRVPSGSSTSKDPDFSSVFRFVSVKAKLLEVGILNSSALCTSLRLTRFRLVAHSFAFAIMSLS